MLSVSLLAFVILCVTLGATESMNRLVRLSRTEVILQGALEALIPPLVPSLHKGQMGRVGIVGGSTEYTGAPFYAAQSSLKLGGDLSYVFCAKQAAIPIKSYSPELMVTPWYDDDNMDETAIVMANRVIEFFPRMHTIVIGCGLGRSPKVLEATGIIINAAKEKGLPLVLDADALYFVSSSSEGFAAIRGHKKLVLTPNKVEFGRLVDAALKGPNWKEATVADQLLALSEVLQGPTILLKGKSDMICDGKTVYEIEESGSPRRSGGQGDILAGMLGTTLHWGYLRDEEIDNSNTVNAPVAAALLASVVTKRASELAFLEHKRSMTTPDLLPKIGPALAEIEEKIC